MSLESKLDALTVAVVALTAAVQERVAQSQSQVSPPRLVVADPPPPARTVATPASPSEKPVETAKPTTTVHQAPVASTAPASPSPDALVQEAKQTTMKLAEIGPGETGRSAAITLLSTFGAKKAGEIAVASLPSYIAQAKAKITELLQPLAA